jgi:small subunit ribosomal protein S18
MTVETETTTTAVPSAAPAGAPQPQGSGPMADGQRRPARRKGEGYGRKYTPRRKVCQFCADKISYVDFKDLSRLRRHLSDRGKIEPRRKTGTCALHQRALATAVKRARHMALLPYTAEHVRISGVHARA